MLNIWQTIKHTKIIPITFTVLVLGALSLFFSLGGFSCLKSNDLITQVVGIWSVIFACVILNEGRSLIIGIIKKPRNEINNTSIIALLGVIVFGYFIIAYSPKWVRGGLEKVSYKIVDSYTGGLLSRLEAITKELDKIQNSNCIKNAQKEKI